MSPAFADKDYVVCVKWPRMSVAIGDVVVVDHPHFNTIIKRIHAISESGAIMLSGDNPLSTDSHALGWIMPTHVRGKVVWHIYSA